MGSIDISTPEEGYRVNDEYHSQPQYLRVICAGAGAAGLCLAYKMKEKFKFENYDLVCYEKNAGVGGTWFENRYPGCACDIPAHAYTYSFEPNPNWSTFYAYGPEIREYFEGFAKKHNLTPNLRLSSSITSAIWDEQQGIYNVSINSNGQQIQDWCHVFINGTGFLNSWKWPKIPGLSDFKGTLLHSANWDTSVDWTGKRVAVIGTGSSAIQMVPQIQKTAKHMTAFMRSVTWISPLLATDMLEKEQKKEASDERKIVKLRQAQYHYSEEDKQRFRDDPQYLLEYRQGIEGAANELFEMFLADSATNKHAEVSMREEMHRRIGEGHDELKAKLIPSWPPGCRRITPGDGYLEALVKPNVTTVHHEIERINETGILDETGTQHDVDMLVCATGFNLAFAPSFDVRGKDGLSMADFFNNHPYGPQVYLATSVPHFPNYFIVNGVRGNWASGTALPSIEICSEYIVRCCWKIQHDHLKSLDVKQEPITQLNEHVDEWHKGSVWNAPCKSWYKNNIVGGKLWIWAGSAQHFMKTMQGEPRFEHYNIEYKENNMWSFLGNGRVKAEVLKGSEGYATGKELHAMLSPYLRKSDTEFQVE